jgi:hypothetical protein
MNNLTHRSKTDHGKRRFALSEINQSMSNETKNILHGIHCLSSNGSRSFRAIGKNGITIGRVTRQLFHFRTDWTKAGNRQVHER